VIDNLLRVMYACPDPKSTYFDESHTSYKCFVCFQAAFIARFDLISCQKLFFYRQKIHLPVVTLAKRK
jgi:hypothetical protein